LKYAFIDKASAELLKQALIKKQLLAQGYPVKSSRAQVGFPVKAEFKFPGVEYRQVRATQHNPSTLPSLLAKELPKGQLEELPSGFDTVGSIAILELNQTLKKHGAAIGAAILRLHSQIKTVVMKASNHEGEFRLQSYTHLAGQRTFETLHRENSIMLRLDISKVYFSPRLSTERMRVAAQVKPNENVLVMFSGCGPYCCLIAKYAKHVTGIELNPIAHEYAVLNKNLNKLSNVTLIQGDVKQVVPGLKKNYHRILMPLPKTGEDFLELMLGAARPGTIVHYYDFEKEATFPTATLKKLKTHIRYFRVLGSHMCGSYGPGISRVCIDLVISDSH
jgi:tRNA (guanine37-N1)-methyltransferase